MVCLEGELKKDLLTKVSDFLCSKKGVKVYCSCYTAAACLCFINQLFLLTLVPMGALAWISYSHSSKYYKLRNKEE